MNDGGVDNEEWRLVTISRMTDDARGRCGGSGRFFVRGEHNREKSRRERGGGQVQSWREMREGEEAAAQKISKPIADSSISWHGRLASLQSAVSFGASPTHTHQSTKTNDGGTEHCCHCHCCRCSWRRCSQYGEERLPWWGGAKKSPR